MTKTGNKFKIKLYHKLNKHESKFQQQQDDDILCWQSLCSITEPHKDVCSTFLCRCFCFQMECFLAFCSTTWLLMRASCFQWEYSSLPSTLSITWQNFHIIYKIRLQKIVLYRLYYFFLQLSRKLPFRYPVF